MRAYIALSYHHKKQLKPVISTIQSVLQAADIDSLAPVYERDFSGEQNKEMMAAAAKELSRSDFIIVEGSYKAVGVGIEAGYMYPLGRPIIYIHNKESEYSTTIDGIASVCIVYSQPSDIEIPLKDAVTLLRKNVHNPVYE